jgi:hypothetical protein
VQPVDRPEFDHHAKVLCAGFNVPATPERVEAYWNGLQRMHLAEFIRCVGYALGEHGPEKIPTASGLWTIRKTVRNPSTADGTTPADNRAAIMAAALRRPLSDWQRAATWSWIVRRFPGVTAAKEHVSEHGADYLGVIIPQDLHDPAKYPPHRIMFRDLAA